MTTPDLGSLSSPLIDTERNLGLLLGLHASYLAMSTPLSPMEIECASESRLLLLMSPVDCSTSDATVGEPATLLIPFAIMLFVRVRACC